MANAVRMATRRFERDALSVRDGLYLLPGPDRINSCALPGRCQVSSSAVAANGADAQ